MKSVAFAFATLVIGIILGMVVIPHINTLPSMPSVGLPTLATAGPTPTSIIRSGPTVIKAIQTQAKLETIVMNIVQDKTIERKHGAFGACSEDITYLGYFNVTAGIDLTKVSNENIAVTNDGQPELATVTLTLPHAEIMHRELDTHNSRLVTQNTTHWVPGCSHQIADMTVEAQQKMQEEVDKIASEQGILTQAEEKAGFELERILLNAGYSKVTVHFTDTKQ